MTPVPLSSSGPLLVEQTRDRMNPRPPVEGLGRPPSATQGMGRPAVDRHPATPARPLDDVVAQIDRARLLIRTCCAGARPALMKELGHVADDLDAAIGRLQDAVLTTAETCAVKESTLLPFIQWAWSEVERRWISMTFHEHQAWLARPDLDPAAFARHVPAL